MSCKNKNKYKNYHAWSTKNLLEETIMNNSDPFNIVYFFNKEMYYSAPDVSIVEKFSIFGLKTLQYIQKINKPWFLKFFFIRQNFSSKIQRLNKQEVKSIKHFISELPDKKEILNCLEYDTNCYIKKQIRYFKNNPIFIPGTLMIWNNNCDLVVHKNINIDTIINNIKNNNAYSILNLLNSNNSNNTVFVIKNTFTMYVVKETIVMFENKNNIFWKRLVEVVISSNNKTTLAVLCFDAFSSKKHIFNSKFFTILKKPETILQNINFIFPKEPDLYDSSENENIFLCNKKENYNMWEAEAKK